VNYFLLWLLTPDIHKSEGNWGTCCFVPYHHRGSDLRIALMQEDELPESSSSSGTGARVIMTDMTRCW
jgi:hypothetical protein